MKYPRWTGAWPEDVFFSFLALTSEESIKATDAGRFYDRPDVPLDALASPKTARDKRIKTHLANYRANEGYKRLRRFPGFDVILAERLRLASENGLLGDPFGEIRLAHIVAGLVGCFDPNFTPKRATLAHQRKVHRATKVLRSLLMPGAQPADVFEMSHLRHLLKELDEHLAISISFAETAGTRPHRADKDSAQRYWLVGFCRRLFDQFSDAPPLIVKEAASMIGYTPDDATVARYIERARIGWMPTAVAADLLHGNADGR